MLCSLTESTHQTTLREALVDSLWVLCPLRPASVQVTRVNHVKGLWTHYPGGIVILVGLDDLRSEQARQAPGGRSQDDQADDNLWANGRSKKP